MMSDNYSHTPGPWRVVTRGNNSPYVASETDLIPFGDEYEGRLVASPIVKGMPNPKRNHAEANARLIAASPELLGVVEHMIGAVRLRVNGNCYLLFNAQIAERARSAVLKARGELT